MIDPDEKDTIQQQAASDQSENTYNPPGGFLGGIGGATTETLEKREVYDEIWEACRNAK